VTRFLFTATTLTWRLENLSEASWGSLDRERSSNNVHFNSCKWLQWADLLAGRGALNCRPVSVLWRCRSGFRAKQKTSFLSIVAGRVSHLDARTAFAAACLAHAPTGSYLNWAMRCTVGAVEAGRGVINVDLILLLFFLLQWKLLVQCSGKLVWVHAGHRRSHCSETLTALCESSRGLWREV
jgi:hypothetical protein